MTALVWDAPGERAFQSGVSRGVLYVGDDAGIAWNGITAIEEDPSFSLNEYYLNGVKYLQYLTPGDYVGALRAFTYPDEFDAVNGNVEIAPGLFYHNQLLRSFSLAYRTLRGDDLDAERGYKLHLLYDVLANPSSFTFDTHNPDVSPVEFGWSLSGLPVIVTGHRPTSHISIDSTKTSVAALEAILYGSDSADPRLPSIAEVTTLLSS